MIPRLLRHFSLQNSWLLEGYHLLSSHFGSSAAALVAGVGHRPLLLAAVSALAPESKSMEAAVKQLEKRRQKREGWREEGRKQDM